MDSINDKTVILVDDGLATGATIKMALIKSFALCNRLILWQLDNFMKNSSKLKIMK